MSPKSILVVEDDLHILEDLVQIFEMEHYSVLQAKNGKEALDLLGTLQELPGLIFLDLMMPVMDGQGFLTEIQFKKINERFKNIPVIVVSAARAEITGNIVGRLKKPPEIDDLIAFATQYCGSAI